MSRAWIRPKFQETQGVVSFGQSKTQLVEIQVPQSLAEQSYRSVGPELSGRDIFQSTVKMSRDKIMRLRSKAFRPADIISGYTLFKPDLDLDGEIIEGKTTAKPHAQRDMAQSSFKV
ncbi:hypothetical protein TWF730_002576 [Orbilia blumenaviensis]|uniref:Uncharacterized protein n=1 Tax=Orbilia blumenaviensis TaxID=1796055 RepID=A0AAV9UAJ0_9PEZI